MKSPLHDDPRLRAAAERHMRSWAHKGENEAHIASSHPGHAGRKTRIYLAISRQSGSGGSEVGQLVGKKLDWPVFDKNLLDRMAERFHESRRILDLVDETRSNWVYDVLGTWMDHKIVPHQKFVAQLRRVILATAAEYQHAVFVGRGAQFILPRREVIAVRIVAPESYRVERIMHERGLNAIEAKRFVLETDRERREFIRQYFHRDINDLSLYDQVINIEETGLIRAFEQVADFALAKTHAVA
jgi:cytidylate kinase